jgi:ATP-dependent DNA ligase
MDFALCKEIVDLPDTTGNMIWQQKLDGVRAFISEKTIRLRTISFSNEGVSVPAGCVLDGEIIGDRFSDVVPALTKRDWNSIKFVPFDIVKHDGDDVRRESLLVRLNLLNEVANNALPIFAFPDSEMPKVPLDWEGVIGKPMRSTYRAGRESWVKWKHINFMDAVILNLENGKGRWSDSVGKIVFGTPEGKVLGTAAGFDERTRRLMTLNGVDYIGKPCVIKHYGMNKRRLRNPIFHGMKEEQ